MLTLLVNSEPVDLLPDASITIDEESPVFDKDTIPGGFSFPFTLPVTPRNRRVFQFPERMEKNGSMSTEQSFQLFHDGKLRATGTINITEAGNDYKATLYCNTGDLAAKIKDKKLKDLNLGGLRVWEWKMEYKYPTDDFALAPVFNTSFFLKSQYAGLFQDYYSRVNAFEGGEFYKMPGNVPYAITPFPFISYILKQIFIYAGIRIIENVFISDADLRDLIMYTIRDITTSEIVYTTATIYLGKDELGNSITQEIYTGSEEHRQPGPFDLINSMPDMTVTDFLLSLRNLLNIAYIIEGDSVRIVKRQDLILKTGAENITSNAINTERLYSVTGEDVKLEWIIDDTDTLWGEDFFNNIDDYLEFIKVPLDAVEDLAALTPVQNEIRYVKSVDLFFRYSWFDYDPDGVHQYRWQWVSWSRNYQNMRMGEAKEVFSCKIAPITTVISHHNPTSGFQRGPFVEQKGSFAGEQTAKTFELRLLFYRGLVHDSLGVDYPYATNDNLDRTGTVLPGKKLALRYDGEYGIYTQLWMNYLTWWSDRKQVNWVIKDPSVLSFSEKYAIDGKQYLLKKRTINLTQKGVEPGECEFYLV